jgi:hypothetical protein
MSKISYNRSDAVHKGGYGHNNYSRSKILVTGDSFIGIFKLFRMKEAKMEVNKIKGATLKGNFLLF